MGPETMDKARQVKLLVFDVDGVLTDGRIVFTPAGEVKTFHVHDGLGITLLRQTGVKVGIITAQKSEAVGRRLADLGIDAAYYKQTHHKYKAICELEEVAGLAPHEIAYVGDDLLDLPVLQYVGFAITVPNASEIVKPYVDWVTTKSGGAGAAREICEYIMQAQQTWENVCQRYQLDHQMQN